MFHFFSKCSLFEQYYAKFTSQKEIKSSRNNKPVTAAYLFVLSDYALMMTNNFANRNNNAQKIFAILEKNLSSSEMDVFDNACDLFGTVIRKTVKARGDWCMSKNSGDNTIYNLYLSFGDLIYAPYYLDNYENSPICIKGITEAMDFTLNFSHVYKLTVEYINDITGE